MLLKEEGIPTSHKHDHSKLLWHVLLPSKCSLNGIFTQFKQQICLQCSVVKKIQVYEISNHCTLFIYVPIFVELGVGRDIWHNNFYKSLQAQPVHFPRTLLKHCFLLLTVSSVCETNRLFQLETVASESVLFCYILATELFLLTSLSTLWPKIL